MPLIFIPTVIFPFVFSKLVFFQVLIGLTFPAYLALAWMEPRMRPPKSILYYSILAYFCAILLSVFFSVDAYRSWWGNQERMNGMFTLLHFFAWLTMAVGVLKSWDGWKRLLNYEVILSVIMAFVAILQKPFPKLLLFPAGDRVGGLLDNPIYMGAYQIFNLSFLALLFLKTGSKKMRIWYGFAAVIDLIAFFLTQSRGAFFGLAAVVGVFTLYYALFTKSNRARFGILGAGAGFFGLYVLAYIFRASAFIASNPILNRLTNLQATTETRLIAWDIAWKGFLERPLTGWGFDAFHILFNLKYNPKSLEFTYYETWFDRAHNTIMDTLAMTGLFGLIAYLAIFISIFVLVWKARKRGWIDLPIAAILTALPIGYFLQNLFVFDHPAAFSMSYLLFAFVIATTSSTFNGEPSETPSNKTHAAPWTLFVIIQIFAVAIVWNCSVRPFNASRHAIIANNLLSAGRIAEGFEELKTSHNISTLYDDEQTFLLSRDIITLTDNGAFTKYPDWMEIYEYAKEKNLEHIAKHPNNTHPLFVHARLLHAMFPSLPEDQMQAEIVAAEQMYLRTIETSPERQQLFYSLARLYSQVGQKEQSAKILKEALDFNPNIGESWWYYGLVTWLELGKEEEGTQAVLSALSAKTPYTPTRAIDLMHVARASALRGDTEHLMWAYENVIPLKDTTSQILIEFSRAFETAGMIDERDALLNELAKVDANVGLFVSAMQDGRADNIDDAIMLVQTEQAEAVSSTNAALDATIASSTQVASSSGAGE